MENTALILIIIALFFLVIIVGLLSVLIYKLMGKQSSQSEATSNSEFHPSILDRVKDLKSAKPKRSDHFCPNHTDEPGEVTCAICDKLFCKTCVKPFKTMHFCKEHLPLVMRHDWDEVLTLKTSTSDPEQGVRLYDVKKELFQKDEIPTYIETHYKINVDHDHIETYLVLFAIRESISGLKEKLKDFIV